MTLVIGMMADSKPAADPAREPDTSSILLCADTLASYVAASPVSLPIQVRLQARIKVSCIRCRTDFMLVFATITPYRIM